MKLLRKMMISCETATFLISKDQEAGISLVEKIKLGFHLMACKFCKLFRKESKFMSDNIDYMQSHPDKSFTSDKMSESRKDAITQALKNEDKNSSENN